jgi:hypothetical protein
LAAAGILGAAALGHAPDASAQTSPTRGVRIDQLQPASPESPFFRAEGPHNPAAEGVEFAVGLTFEYLHDPLTEKIVEANGATTSTKVVTSALLTRIGASITPVHWLAFELGLPFALYEAGNTSPDVGNVQLAAGKGPGVGDLRIGAHFRPLDTKLVGVILGGRIWAPFGSQGSYLSDRNFRGELDVAVAGEAARVLYGVTFNVSPGFFVRRAGDRVAGSAAIYAKLDERFAIGLEPSFEVVSEAKYAFPGGQGGNSFGAIVEPLVGVRARFAGFRVGLAGGPGFGGGMGAADGRVLLNLAYVGLGKPPKGAPQGPPDRDLDGIPDDVDACPDEAGPASSDPKRNGCPTHDRDGDGVPDAEDFCPDRAGIPYPDPKANGCPDSDNDGLPDPIDQCVNEPGPPPSGCPKYARLTSGGFKIDPPIDFGTGDKLKAEGRAAIEELAATMRANPKIEQVSISIGTKGARPAQSDKRAQEILLILQAVNLDSSRYEIVLKDDLKSGVVTVRLAK